MITFLTAVSGIAWTIVYIAAIRIGFAQQTYALPAMALALNIAWESIYSVWGIATDPGLQAAINVLWASADLVIVYTFLRYGRRELPPFVTRWMFGCWAVGIFATAYVVQWAFVVEFGYAQAARYTAFLQNLLMSVLFIDRKSTRLNSSHANISYAVFCLKKKINQSKKKICLVQSMT